MMRTMASVTDSYFQALSRLDVDAYTQCFRADAELLDPYGGRPFSGIEGLKKWFSGIERTWSMFSMEPQAHYSSGDRVAVMWRAVGRAHSGREAAFSGINVFTIDADGLIARLEGYWDFQAMLAQIS